MGCHVMVEKPMAETVDECNRMIQVAKATGRVLTINHSARTDPIVLRALDLVRSGAIGDVLAVHFFRSSDYPPYEGGPLPAPFRRGAYPFEDLGVHALCLMESFLGPILRVEARHRSTGRQPNIHFDEWQAAVECEKGPGHVYISWNSQPMQNEIVLHGTRGLINVDCYLQTIAIQKKLVGPKPIQRIVGTTLAAARTCADVTLNAFKFVAGRLKPNPGIQVSIHKFYEALRDGTAAPVPAEEGRRMIAAMAHISKAADEAKIRALRIPRQVDARILVTGAAGLVGSALVGRLRREGHNVRVFVRRPVPEFAADPGVEILYGDLGDPAAVMEAVRGIDTVYHAGAAMSGGKAAFDAGTVWGTRNIVSACLRHNVRRLVYVSSIVLLDHAGHKPGAVVDESHPLEPHADRRGYYTQAKLTAEQIVKDAVDQHGLEAVIIRPGQVFGRGSEKFAPAGAIGFAGRWIIVGDGSLRLPLVYVEDLVDALLLASTAVNVAGSVFNIVDYRDHVTQNDYIGACRTLLGDSLRVLYVPKAVLWAAAVMAASLSRITRIQLPLSPYRLRSSRPLGPFECTAARDVLGWRPRVGARHGIEQSVRPNIIPAGLPIDLDDRSAARGVPA
jgi:nucleoside-diphosphate-sugar epimerase/predicted dehydrogenase